MTDTLIKNVLIKSGVGATLTIAANDSPARSKVRADYICDGTADDVQIQAALDALPAGGGKVLLCEGTFYTVKAIQMPDHCTLEGLGYGTQIIKPTGVYSDLTGDASGTTVTVVDASGFSVGDEVYLSDDDADSDWSNEFHTISVINGNVITIGTITGSFTTAKNARLTNEFPLIRIGKGNIGVVHDSYNVSVHNLYLNGNKANRTSDDSSAFRNALLLIEARNSPPQIVSNHHISNIWLEDNASDHLAVSRTDNVTVQNCNSSGSDAKAYHVGASARNVTMIACNDVGSVFGGYLCVNTDYIRWISCSWEDNTTNGFYCGINNDYWTVENCLIDGSTGNGMQIGASGANPEYWKIVNCTIMNAGAGGIQVGLSGDNAPYWVIANNVIKTTATYGVYIRNGNHGLVAGNVIGNNTNECIYVHFSSQISVVNNITNKVVTAGSIASIKVRGNENIISNNLVKHNGSGDAINFNVGGTENICIGNITEDGAIIDDGTNNIVANNNAV